MSKRRKTIIILVLILIIIIFSTGLINTLARYVRNVNLKRQVDIAFWIIDDQYEREENLLLSDISPSENPYEYLISVANFKDNKRTETERILALWFMALYWPAASAPEWAGTSPSSI